MAHHGRFSVAVSKSTREASDKDKGEERGCNSNAVDGGKEADRVAVDKDGRGDRAGRGIFKGAFNYEGCGRGVVGGNKRGRDSTQSNISPYPTG